MEYSLLNITLLNVQFFLIIFVRCVGFFLLVPVIGAIFIPLRIKICLAFILSWVLFPILSEVLDFKVPIQDLYTFGFILVHQFMIGILLGFILDLMMLVFQIIGQLVSFQMGLSIAEVIDPLKQLPSYTLGQFLGFLGLLIFFYLRGHIILIEVFYESFKNVFLYIDLHKGNVTTSYEIFKDIFETFKWLFECALRISMPILGTLFIVYISLGILGKLVPQMNIFILGFSIYIIVGFSFMILYIPYLVDSSKMFMKEIFKNIFYVWK